MGFATGAGLALLICSFAAARVGRRPPATMVGRDFSAHVDVNTATLEQLRLLPGVGPALAKRIMRDREANGPFASVDALDRVSGIGPRTVDRFAPLAVARPAGQTR